MAEAIVGGLIGGIAVVAGVLLAHFLEQRREDRQELRRLVARLDIAIRGASMVIFDAEARAKVIYPLWGQAVNNVTVTLAELNMWSRGKGRDRASLREQVQRLNILFTAAVGTVEIDRVPGDDELVEITECIRTMHNLVFAEGARSVSDPAEFDAQVAFLRDNGLNARYESDSDT